MAKALPGLHKMPLFFAALFFFAAGARAQTTAFTFQGRLNDNGSVANGNYDIQLKLFNTATVGSGTQIGSTINLSAVPVTSGVFTVQADFGANAFPGADRFLEVGVKPAGSGNPFNILNPRQPITPTPYAIHSVSATTANSATNATNASKATNATNATTATNATQLGGQPANNYVLTNDARLTDARPPTPGSNNYIRNTTTLQTANFNISGDGDVGGGLVAHGAGSNVGVLGSGTIAGVSGKSTNGSGVSGNSTNGSGVSGTTVVTGSAAPPYLAGVYGSGGTGVYGTSSTGYGVYGDAYNGIGVYGISNSVEGVHGFSPSGTGVSGRGGSQSEVGIGVSGAGTGQGSIGVRATGASWFSGNTTPLQGISGTGVVIASNPGLGLVFAFDYGTVTPGDLALNSPGGRVGIGMTAPARTLDVNGRARVGSIPLETSFAAVCFTTAGDLVQCGGSSLRWKTNLQPFTSGLDVVRRLRPISFNWKESELPDIGLAAEEVAQVEPSFVFRNSKGEPEGVKYERLNMALINAVQEQQKEIDGLKEQRKEIEQLKVEIKLLRAHSRAKRK
jgi:hypothetical protein